MFLKMLIWFSLQLRILCIGGKAGRGALRPAPESVEQGLPYGLPNGLLYGLPFGLPYSLPLVSSTVSRPQSVARRLSYGPLLFRGLSYDLRYAHPLVSRMVSRPESVVRPLLYGLPLWSHECSPNQLDQLRVLYNASKPFVYSTGARMR